jgi:hypothetical protein
VAELFVRHLEAADVRDEEAEEAEEEKWWRGWRFSEICNCRYADTHH